VLFMLEGVEVTARQTIELIESITHLMQTMKQKIRLDLPKIYSQDLLNNLFRHPYTKIEFVVDELKVTRKTAAKYLDELVDIGVLQKHRIVKDNFYLNIELYELLRNVGGRSEDSHG
jgi:Fic family protein